SLFAPLLWRVPTGSGPAGASVPGQRGAPRGLGQHDPEEADALAWRPRGPRPAPRAPQAAEDTGGHRVARAPGVAHAVPHPLAPGPPAQELARVCAGATAPPLWGPRH